MWNEKDNSPAIRGGVIIAWCSVGAHTVVPAVGSVTSRGCNPNATAKVVCRSSFPSVRLGPGCCGGITSGMFSAGDDRQRFLSQVEPSAACRNVVSIGIRVRIIVHRSFFGTFANVAVTDSCNASSVVIASGPCLMSVCLSCRLAGACTGTLSESSLAVGKERYNY